MGPNEIFSTKNNITVTMQRESPDSDFDSVDLSDPQDVNLAEDSNHPAQLEDGEESKNEDEENELEQARDSSVSVASNKLINK